MRDERREQLDAQKEQTEHQAATQAATQMARDAVSKRLQNPDFLDQLQNADVNSEAMPWLESKLGPRLSGQRILGYRSEEHEDRMRWATEAAQERMIVEGEPGRLCKGPLRTIAQGKHGTDKVVREEFTAEEKRAIRDAHDVAESMASLSIEGKGIDSLTTATTVTKREEQTDEKKSLRERGAKIFG